MALYETDSINNARLTNKIGHTFSHEIVEGTLIHGYNLGGYKYRWFRDGLSDYLAFRFCRIVAPEAAKEYFVKDRLSSAAEFAGKGNLLDWRGNGPIERVDKGKLYGDKFIYFNEVGQYGRSFKLFKDLFQENEDGLIQVLEKIEREENISVEKVLDIMSEVTGEDIEQLISEY
ncbi:hypothetical protein [Salinimicrobium soli]|uniref:hypothetical protein n=1 Tax=Salinimicrobium soli TaxID=1254399 RepID=UPI003AB094CB